MYFALIGNTPLVKIDEDPEIFAKLEYMNPFGSVKDRIALELFKGDSSEISSGNTGIALAAIASVLGKKSEVFVPESATEERKALLKLLGAKVMEIPDDQFRNRKKRKDIYSRAKFRPLGQYDNPVAVRATVKLAEEIKREVEPDFVVTGVGTGATAEGLARIFGERKVIGVIGDIPGLAPDREYPKQLKRRIRIVKVGLDSAVKGTKLLISRGIFAGLSSGANYIVARKLKRTSVIIAHDSVFRYLSFLGQQQGLSMEKW